MIGLILGFAAAPLTSVGNSFERDKVVLLEAARACHLHEGAIYFIKYSRSDAPTIRATRELGDTEAQITCALQRLPGEVIAKYHKEIDGTPPPALRNRRRRAAETLRRRSAQH